MTIPSPINPSAHWCIAAQLQQVASDHPLIIIKYVTQYQHFSVVSQLSNENIWALKLHDFHYPKI